MTHSVTASCHCGAVRITAEATSKTPTRCTCTFCRRRQAGNISARADSLHILRGADALSLYQWGSHTAEHYFCKHCGIYTHHRRRSDPSEIGINIGCVDGAKPWDHEPMHWHDGVKHPSDVKA